MKRRDFIKTSALASGLFFVPSFVRAFENISPINIKNRKLVVIQLSGGNDGLNTIIPFRNDLYYSKRPNIAIKPNELIGLTSELGLHPSLTPLKELYDQGLLTIINNVGYPNPVRSHFRATDIWSTASDASEYLSTGWIGRLMDTQQSPSHYAIDVNNKLSLSLKGANVSGVTVQNPKSLYQNAKDPFFDKLIQQHHLDQHLSEKNLGYLYKQMIQAESSASYIFENSKTYQSNSTYQDNVFEKQLKNIAQFINSHLDTQVYYASLGGFDTHFNQPTRQQKLMEVFSNGINTFIKDLQKNNTLDNTLVMVFSEFGRRVEENASKGTDHGAANNVFILGNQLKKPGVFNNIADLNKLDENGDIIYDIDFRDIYATILNEWLQVDASKIIKNPTNTINII